MAQRWRGSARDLFGRRRPGDDREEMGIYEEAPLPSAPPVVFRQSPYDWNTLWGAAALGYSRILVRILERGTPPDFPDPMGRTALMLAAEFGQTDTVCVLLDAGADPNRRDKEGRTSLFYIDDHRYEDTLNALVNGGADLNTVDDRGHTVLLQAILDSDTSRASILLKAGASPNIPFVSEMPVDMAIRIGSIPLVQILRYYGAVSSREPLFSLPE